MKICIVNGSLGGAHGNTAHVLEPMITALQEKAEVDIIHLAEDPSGFGFEARLREADGFVFATGTYWDSWGSPLQKFLENSTSFEGGPVWLGKPAAAVVTMHSVGGKELLSRLQGVLCTLGLWLPPMSGFVYSLANHLALQAPDTDGSEDLWQLADLHVIAANLLTAVRTKNVWTVWPIDKSDPKRLWMK